MADASHPLTRMLGIIYALCSAYSACCTVHLFVTGARPKILQRQTLQRATSEVAREFWAVTLAHIYDVHIWWVITLCSRPSQVAFKMSKTLRRVQFFDFARMQYMWNSLKWRKPKAYQRFSVWISCCELVSIHFWIFEKLTPWFEKGWVSSCIYSFFGWFFPCFFCFLFGWLIDDSSWRFLRLWTMPPKRCLGSSATWAIARYKAWKFKIDTHGRRSQMHI